MLQALAGDRDDERFRAFVAGLCGVVAGVAVAWWVPWQLTVLVIWDAIALVMLVWTWARIGRLDAAETKTRSARQEDSRDTTRLLLSTAAVVSLVGVALTVLHAKKTSGGLTLLLNCTAVGSVVVSWLLVHTLFTLRYARLYYSGDPGGVDFNDDEPPDFLDFAYLAFTIGMTFQVSDTDLQTKPIRRAALRHALLSYLFGAVIVATMINVVASFVQ